MRTPDDWVRRQLGPVAVLVVGWRSNRNLRAARISLAGDMDAELRSRAATTLAAVGFRTIRAYEETAHLEVDEVFLLDITSLPSRQSRRRSRRDSANEPVVGDQQEEASAL